MFSPQTTLNKNRLEYECTPKNSKMIKEFKKQINLLKPYRRTCKRNRVVTICKGKTKRINNTVHLYHNVNPAKVVINNDVYVPVSVGINKFHIYLFFIDRSITKFKVKDIFSLDVDSSFIAGNDISNS